MNGLNWLWENASTLAAIATLLALLTALATWVRLLHRRKKPFVLTAADFHPSLLPGDWTVFIRIRNRSDQPLSILRIDIWGPRKHYLRSIAGDLTEGKNMHSTLAVFSQDSATLAPGSTFSTSNHDLDHDAATTLFRSDNQLGVITDRGDYALSLPKLQIRPTQLDAVDFELETSSRWAHTWNKARVWLATRIRHQATRCWLLGIKNQR